MSRFSCPGFRNLDSEDFDQLKPGEILFAADTVSRNNLPYIVVAHSYEVSGIIQDGIIIDGEYTNFKLTTEDNDLIQALLTLDPLDQNYESYKRLYKEKHLRGETRTVALPISPRASLMDTLSILVVITMVVLVVGGLIAAAISGC